MHADCGTWWRTATARPFAGTSKLRRVASTAALLLSLTLIPAAQGRLDTTAPGARGASVGEILFIGAQVGARSMPVMVMNADGSGRRTLFTLPGPGPVEPLWRPDGASFTYTRGRALWEADADGGHRREVYPQSGVLSPDGSKIAVRGGPGATYTVIVDLQTGAEHMTRDWFSPVGWQSNGSLLAFHPNTDGESGLAGGVYELSSDAVRGRLWSSRVSEHITFSRDHTVAVGTTGMAQPVVLRSDGSKPRDIALRGSGIDMVQTISVSPDGRQVVYAGYDSTAPYPAENKVVDSGIDGSNPHVVALGAEPSWRPTDAGGGHSGSNTGPGSTGGNASGKRGPCETRATVGRLVLAGACIQRDGSAYVTAKPVRIDGLDFVPRSGELSVSARRLTGDVSIIVAGDETYRGRLDVDPTLQPALTPFGSSSVGGLPLAAVSFAFDGSHGGRARVHLDLELPFLRTEGSAEVDATTEAGSSLAGVHVSVPGGVLAGLPVNRAELRYQRQDESGRSVWSAQVELPIFGLDPERGLVLGGSLVDGQLGSLTLGLATPNEPLGETGLFVQEGDVTLGLHPVGIAFHGAFTLGPVPGKHVPALAELDGTGSIFHDSACDPSSGRAFARLVLSADALKVLGFTAGQARLCATTDGFISFAADAHLDLYAVGIAGMFQGQANAHALQATGSVAIAIPGHTWGGDGVVSDVGFGGCATLVTLKKPKHWYDPTHWQDIPIRAGGGSRWNGQDRHTFFGSGCGWDRWSSRSLAVRQSSTARRTAVSVPRGTEAPAFVFDGSGGAPVVTLTGPGGTSITTPSGSDPFVQTDTYVAFRDDVEHSTYVALLAPRPGSWTATTAPGSPPVIGTQESRALPAPRVSATVSGRGAVRTLRWRLSAQPGLRVRFSEQNFGALRTIATVSAARGSLRFRPTAAAGRRRLVALFLENGEPRGLVQLQTFTPPRPRRPGRAARIRVQMSRSTAVVRWRRAARAAAYRVAVRIGSRDITYFSRGTRIEIENVGRKKTIAIRLTAVSAHGLAGPARSKRVRVP